MGTTPEQSLNYILDYIGGCEAYRDNAQLLTYIEWAAKTASQKPPRTEGPICAAPGYVPTDNGKNKRFIVLTCEYEMYDTEWNEIARLITDVLPADFSAVSVRVEGT